MVPFLFIVFCFTGPDPVEVARLAVKNYQADQLTALKYSYTENDDDKNKGPVVYEVSTIQGLPYERVISRNGTRLSGEAEAKEQQKYENTVSKRADKSPVDREKRLKNFEEQTKFLDEAPEAFDFKMLPGETIKGRETLVVACTPKPGFHPGNMRSKMFTKLQAKAWVDRQDMRIVKIEADLTDAVPIGLIMARVGRGTHMEMEQMRLADGTWVLKRLAIGGKAKILLVDNKVLDETVVYSDYH